jgi:endonuclease YncB( thermonuclease family)
MMDLTRPDSSPDLPASYTELRVQVARILSEGKERARRAVEFERVKTYWEVGGVLNVFLAAHDSVYGKQVMKKLAVAVDLSERLLYEMAEMRQRLKILAPGPKLTWSHCRRLIRIADPKARAYYQKAAEESQWSVRELESQIKADAYKQASAGQNAGETGALQAIPKSFRAVRGELYISRVTERKGKPALGLGFGCQHELVEGIPDGFQMGDLVRSVNDPAAPEGYRLEPANVSRRIYASSAAIYKMIDGDTLWASVGVGFRSRTDQKLRLRAIDTPELKTAEGQRAREYLERTLADAGEFVVTTQKIDLYDRYLADVFYLPGERDMERVAREGRYLNRELVEEGLARPWTSEKPPDL